MKHVHVPTLPELAEQGLAIARADARDPRRVVYTPTSGGQARIYDAMKHNAAQPAAPVNYRRESA